MDQNQEVFTGPGPLPCTTELAKMVPKMEQIQSNIFEHVLMLLLELIARRYLFLEQAV